MNLSAMHVSHFSLGKQITVDQAGSYLESENRLREQDGGSNYQEPTGRCASCGEVYCIHTPARMVVLSVRFQLGVHVGGPKGFWRHRKNSESQNWHQKSVKNHKRV